MNENVIAKNLVPEGLIEELFAKGTDNQVHIQPASNI